MRNTLLFVLAALALVAVGCSSDDGGGGSEPAGGGCTEANATDLSADDPFTITVRDFEFQPNCFKAASASSITIVNEDSDDHTFTIPDTQVDAPLSGGQTFNGESAGLAPGTYDFLCTIHPDMTGTVIVV